ncbi:hypothetical protein NDR87_13845 [Nocardia sp. CDC159]|uniref:Uncharacterized protein n=1 Tax=Nocardia pulmonis TaxID=2951408 RepID=A0A9X2E7X0_9NOCA|nr:MULTISPECIES: hypothetical protein [Nocardia]MCM6774495.1 hypothetical protein [Nocardia pulmonis]MCM6787439.1 hypothetical protein [Nocardia sp. CDC159]
MHDDDDIRQPALDALRADTDLWPTAFQHAGQLTRQRIAADPSWWDTVATDGVGAESVTTLLAWAIWDTARLARDVSLARGVFAGHPDPAPHAPDLFDGLELSLVADLLRLDPATAAMRDLADSAVAQHWSPLAGTLATVAALAVDPARQQLWQRLVRVTLGFVVGHVQHTGRTTLEPLPHPAGTDHR